MGYNCSPSCTRINYWSNPLKTYTDGQAMGTSSQSDNARVLNATAATVAGFRGDVTPPPPGTTFTNTTDYNIPDNNTTGISSSVTSTRSGQSGTVSVAVNIVHPYIGDLIVDLIAPSGTVYNLHNRSGGSADNIVKTYSVNAGTTASNGVWKLRAKDRAAADVGYINSWSITFP
ncbi:MAG: proprotein convertase P-domain-containing protein [Gammaproteobacteria bacterium]|nr:proprotein convertase P-domain-containing protein [Gammaproteobacteria bacterium]